MATVADIAAGAAGAAAVLAIVLTVLALQAWRRTRSARSIWLSAAFLVSAVQAAVTAFLLQAQADLPPEWLSVPIAHGAAMLLIYIALLRV